MKNDAISLLDAIDKFLVAKGMSPITFGRSAMRDPHFVRDLRNGRRVWPETETKVRAFIAAYRPPTSQQAEAA